MNDKRVAHDFAHGERDNFAADFYVPAELPQNERLFHVIRDFFFFFFFRPHRNGGFSLVLFQKLFYARNIRFRKNFKPIIGISSFELVHVVSLPAEFFARVGFKILRVVNIVAPVSVERELRERIPFGQLRFDGFVKTAER